MNTLGGADELHHQQCNASIEYSDNSKQHEVEPELLREVVLVSEYVALSDHRSTVDFVSILVLHQRLETVFKHRDVLQRVEDLRYLRKVIKESTDKHQRDNSERCESSGYIQVTYQSGYHECIAGRTEVDELTDEESPKEYVCLVVEITGEVGYSKE